MTNKKKWKSRLETKLARVKADAGRWGWGRAIGNRIMGRVLHSLGIYIHIVRTHLLDPNARFPELPPNIELRKISTEEVQTASLDAEMQLDREFVDSALERGDIPFGAFDSDLLVSYVWRTRTTAPHTRLLSIRVDQPYCYAYKSYTRPSHRGKHISPAVHLFSDIGMREYGYERRAGFVAIENTASLSMGKYMNSTVIGYAGYLYWFGKFFFFRSTAVKDIGFEFLENTRR